MKIFFLDFYKVYYSFGNSRYPDMKPSMLGDLSASGAVFFFIGIALLNVYMLLHLVWGVPAPIINKGELWLLMLVGYYLVYLLLFKVWRLERRNYCLPPYKPDRLTQMRIWTIVFINVGIAIIMFILRFTILEGK